MEKALMFHNSFHRHTLQITNKPYISILTAPVFNGNKQYLSSTYFRVSRIVKITYNVNTKNAIQYVYQKCALVSNRLRQIANACNKDSGHSTSTLKQSLPTC